MTDKEQRTEKNGDPVEIAVDLTMYITAREGETKREAVERLRSLLDSEICNLADHQINYQVYKTRSI